MIPGGPGGAGNTLYPTAIPWLTYIDNTFDLYIPDHRGTGYSNPIECPSDLLGLPANCTSYLDDVYGDDIHYFSTYQAAMDLGYVLDLFIDNLGVYSNDNTIIYGVSYGTYYLNEYLQIFPDQIQGVILDGICSPDQCRVIKYDENFNNVGINLLNLCDNDVFCYDIFEQFDNVTNDDNNSSVIIQILSDIYLNIANNSNIIECIDAFKVDASLLQYVFAMFLLSDEGRIFIPPIIYRLERCNENDTEILTLMFEYILSEIEQQIENRGNFTSILTFNIILSELWNGADPTDPGPSYRELVTIAKDYYFSSGLTTEFRRWWDDWNKYEVNEEFYNKFADPSMPMLLLNGDLDPQTPYELAIHSAEQYGANIDDNINIPNAKNRYFYTIPNAPHFTMFNSRIRNYTDHTLHIDLDFETCGMYIIASFINPQNNFIPDNECIHWLNDIDWNGDDDITQQLSSLIFGIDNVWDGVPFSIFDNESFPISTTDIFDEFNITDIEFNNTDILDINDTIFTSEFNETDIDIDTTDIFDMNETIFTSEMDINITDIDMNLTDISDVNETIFASEINITDIILDENDTDHSGSLIDTTIIGGELLPNSTSSKEDNAWYIVGIIFAVLFGIALIIVAYLCYRRRKNPMNKFKNVKDGKGKYGATHDHVPDIETGTINKTEIAEDSEQDLL